MGTVGSQSSWPVEQGEPNGHEEQFKKCGTLGQLLSFGRGKLRVAIRPGQIVPLTLQVVASLLRKP
jgi:hypothetical protein